MAQYCESCKMKQTCFWSRRNVILGGVTEKQSTVVSGRIKSALKLGHTRRENSSHLERVDEADKVDI